MKKEQKFAVNQPNVVHEELDGEVIIVNLESGIYYSLGNSGVDIWQNIDRGFSLSEIIVDIERRYTEKDNKMEVAINNIIEELLLESLILTIERSTEEERENNSPKAIEKKPFSLPKLEKYTDLEDLLLIDPIHEVDEMGWPHAKPEN